MSKQKTAYTLEEDTLITAQSAVNIVRSTRQGVDPVPFVAALLEGYAQRVRTLYAKPEQDRKRGQRWQVRR